MFDFIVSLGFSSFDMALIIVCPVGAVLGSFAQVIFVSIRPSQPPTDETREYVPSKKLQVVRGTWLGLRLMLGGILGLALGLYFVGSLQETAGTLSKILALSILVGFSAPRLWAVQDQRLATQLSKTDIYQDSL